ncbi:MAG: hypothetical protein OEZ06_20720 [Myxococcales bacterium]|nr:hypothetical protein [Myxococcales bacterium]
MPRLKKKRPCARSAVELLAWCGLLLTTPVAAQAPDSGVVLWQSPEQPRPGLVHALRIQLAGAAELSVRQAPEGLGLSARVQAAGALAEREQVLLVVWVEAPAPAPAVAPEAGGESAEAAPEDSVDAAQDAEADSEAVLYMVGRKQGRAMLEVVRVPGGGGPALERSLALKVREGYDAVLRAAEAAPDAGLLLQPPPPPAEAEAPAPTAGGFGALWRVGAEWATLPSRGAGQFAIALGAGPTLAISPALRLSVELGIAYAPSIIFDTSGRQLEFSELSPSLTLLLAGRRGPWAFGGGMVVAPSLALAEGRLRTAAGAVEARAQATEAVPSIAALGALERKLDGGLWLRLSLGPELRLRRQHFAVRGDQLADLGRLRLRAGLALLLRTD